MAKNETTSKRVASIASRVLANDTHKKCVLIPFTKQEHKALRTLLGDVLNYEPIGTMADIKALAASALTQTENKPFDLSEFPTKKKK